MEVWLRITLWFTETVPVLGLIVFGIGAAISGFMTYETVRDAYMYRRGTKFNAYALGSFFFCTLLLLAASAIPIDTNSQLFFLLWGYGAAGILASAAMLILFMFLYNSLKDERLFSRDTAVRVGVFTLIVAALPAAIITEYNLDVSQAAGFQWTTVSALVFSIGGGFAVVWFLQQYFAFKRGESPPSYPSKE